MLENMLIYKKKKNTGLSDIDATAQQCLQTL